jgi:hypothetical protein
MLEEYIKQREKQVELLRKIRRIKKEEKRYQFEYNIINTYNKIISKKNKQR